MADQKNLNEFARLNRFANSITTSVVVGAKVMGLNNAGQLAEAMAMALGTMIGGTIKAEHKDQIEPEIARLTAIVRAFAITKADLCN